MLQNEETRRRLAPRRAPGNVFVGTNDNPEFTPPLLSIQAAWLSRKLGLTADRARLLAGLAFEEVHHG